jgi:hypothetical protein
MSPLKQSQHSSMSFTSCGYSIDDTDMRMEESTMTSGSFYSSPPRSAPCLAATNRRKELFGGGGANTPKTRRLFGEAEDSERRSPLPYVARRTLKPLDRNNLNDSSESSLSSSPVTGRKRSSVERRGERDERSASDESTGATAMYASPRISPNSFLTMDGRFVQSKNPFSSPMMTDTPTLQQPQLLVGATHAAPSLPVSFYASQRDENGLDAKMAPSFLPQRNHHNHPLLQPKQGTPVAEATAGLHAFSISGYPEIPRYGFTCSPIPEQGPAASPSTRRHATNRTQSMESTDIASAGSLHKVRRIHLSDDVVAATGHHLSNLSSRRVTDYPVVNTSYVMCMHNSYDNDDGISPTDVFSFPSFPTPAVPKTGPPPTPVKQRPSQQLYSSCNSSHHHRPPRTPGPPMLARKAGVRVNSTTPHHHHPSSLVLGSYMAGDEPAVDTGHGTSRFHSDFDVIGELGHGSFGTVYKVLSRLDGCMYAIKAAQRQAKGVADRDRMLKEVCVCVSCDTSRNYHVTQGSIHSHFLRNRSTHWRLCRIKPTRLTFTSSVIIRPGWKTIVSTFKRNSAVGR